MRVSDEQLRNVVDHMRPRWDRIREDNDQTISAEQMRAAIVEARRAGEQVRAIGSDRSMGRLLEMYMGA
jgi:hypothetical protein